MVVRANISQLPANDESYQTFTFSRGIRRNTPKKRPQEDDELFTELYMRGHTYQDIADVFSVDRSTAVNWRKRLKLPQRNMGCRRRETRIRMMAEQITKRVGKEVGPMRDIFRRWGVVDSAGRHVNGTDKETNHHYGDAYDDLFRAYDLDLHGWYSTRDKVQLMMEVGNADGSSLCAWADAFPHAVCVGLDIHPITQGNGDHRIEFHLGDQRSREDCERATAGRQFDLIVEDAVHSTGNTLLTLFWLWPFVKPGGLYVVEEWADVHTDWKRITELFPLAQIKPTTGPSGGIEPLVFLRKPQ